MGGVKKRMANLRLEGDIKKKLKTNLRGGGKKKERPVF